MATYVEYSSNNSGGRWWLNDQNWRDLEAAGWVVAWATLEVAYDEDGASIRLPSGLPKLVPIGTGGSKYSGLLRPGSDGRWLGALATTAYKPDATSIREAADEWERITGESATAAGCPCCGQPHTFTLYRNSKCVEIGPSTSFEASW